MMRQQGVTNEDDNYVVYLKGQVEKLSNEVRTLKSRTAYGGGRRGSLRELRVTYNWTEDDLDCSEDVMKFCGEYLFPRFKFLEKGWIVLNTPQDGTRSFSMFVKKHLPLPDDMVFEEKWDNLIAPTIVKKYTDMRCNVNGFVRKLYLSEYMIQWYCDITIPKLVLVDLLMTTTLFAMPAKRISAMEEICSFQKS